ncbi:MAG TPA: beta-L-arabinofuranosidase domain-containing protein [Bacteroidales bacterium]|nr:beta-L-arabinofuranosidase domain-containing protein [Bacteroidales bacterium]
MKKFVCTLFTFVFFLLSTTQAQERNSHYITNQEPLVAQPYTALPLGNIKPEGWLLEMLKIQRAGLTGNLDSVYEKVCGPTNGWLGGIGDGWERGPYWLDGLVPLAYLLDDDELKDKAQEWIEWSIENQRENGYFGPKPLPEDAPKIPGTQQGNREDWWPKMVMLKVLKQYYMATGDDRVIDLMSGYFRYQLENLPEYPLGHWTYWAERRGGDNMAIVYWLYNITGEDYLLELAELLNEQTHNWTKVYSDGTIRNQNPYPHLHCVNVAQGLKQPVVYYQQHPEQKYLDAVKEGLDALHDSHGFVSGMYGGDEHLHGNDPTQGSELCTAIEMMYSYENILPITGDVYYADYLEKVAFNVLPTQHNDDFTRKQYFQQANQVLVSNQERNFYNHPDHSSVFGVKTGYPCCLTNMHQGYPKFVQNLWYATADNGLAALVYSASQVEAKVAGGTTVRMEEKTNYPFSNAIKFIYKTEKSVRFPFHLRIPAWCDQAVIRINGETWKQPQGGQIVVLERRWKEGDRVELNLPMKINTSRWYESSVGLERGPLVYALKIGERWEEVKIDQWKHSYYEVTPVDPWNYGLVREALEKNQFELVEKDQVASMPWNPYNAPVSIKTTGKKIPFWQMYRHSAGKIPSPARPAREIDTKEEEISLIPYGCTTLRISEFPVVE